MSNHYADLQERVNRLAQPLTVLFELTYRCNYACSFCYNPKNLRPELTTEQVFQTLEQLAKLNVLFVNFTGGEATLRPDLYDIVAKARGLDFAVCLFTNGHNLTRDKIRRLKDLGVFNIEISLHGSTPEIHDARVKMPGSFEKLRAVFATLAEEGQMAVLKCPVTKANFDDLVNVNDYAESFGLPIVFDTKITPTDEGDMSPLNEKITPQQLLLFWRDIAPRVGLKLPDNVRSLDPKEHNCGVGASSMVIDPYGQVYPCVQWRKSLGNVLESPLDVIWAGPEVVQIRQISREVNQEAIQKLGQEVANNYFNCPGMALHKFGNAKAMDPDDVKRAEMLVSLKAGGTSPESVV